LGDLDGFWEFLRDWDFWGRLQRRGVHVNIPKIGSRDGEKCSGGIQRFYAELRRELVWGNLNLAFFGFLGGSPRGAVEEGDHLCFLCAFEGIYCVVDRGLIKILSC
jgi:hypothetical protein